MAYTPNRLGVTKIDLSGLPAPSAIEALDQPTLFSDWVDEFTSLDPQYTVLLESQPAIKLCETGGYREMIQRQRVNDGLKALLLTKSYGTNLDAMGAYFGCYRLLVTPQNNSTIPATPAIYESDDDFRSRIALCPDAWSGAGPEDAYKYQARTSDPNIKDVAVYGHPIVNPGTVLVVVLTQTDDQMSAAVKNAYARLHLPKIKPLTDNIQVRAATLVPYDLTAILHIGQGPDPSTVQSAAIKSLSKYVATRRKIGKRHPISGIDGSLNIGPVDYVELLSPTVDQVPDYLSYAEINNMTVSVVVDR